jgi:hypothetical protein
MLVNKNLTGSIVCFKISNGDEVIAKIVSETAEGWVLSRPCTLIPSTQGLSFIQSLMAIDIDTQVPLNRVSVILGPVPVVEQLESYYIQSTTSISTPDKSGIIV